MRERIMQILTKFEGTAFYPYSSSVVEALSGEILTLISEEIGKMENPYKEDFPRGHSPATYRIRRARRASFEDCRQKILALLRSEK